MNPKHWRDISDKVADEQGIPREHMEAMVESYYKEVKNMLRNVSCYELRIQGLGKFVINPDTINKEIYRNESLLNSPRCYRRDDLQQTTDLYKDIQRWLKQKKQKEIDRIAKHYNELERDTKTGMGEQGSDK